MAIPVQMRNCPMCGTAPGEGEGVILTAEQLVDLETGFGCYPIGFTARCCNCGVSVSDEYQDEVVRLWNGEPVANNGDAMP